MSPALVSITVWRDSGPSAVVSVYQDGKRIDRVKVVPGDTLDLELDEGSRVVVGKMPREEEVADDFAAQDAVHAAELEAAS